MKARPKANSGFEVHFKDKEIVSCISTKMNRRFARALGQTAPPATYQEDSPTSKDCLAIPLEASLPAKFPYGPP